LERFNAEATKKEAGGYRLLSVNGKNDILWDELPLFRGSHFVRDPRDLVVSGYHYHLWTEEAWCKDVHFNWETITAHPYFRSRVEKNESKFPQNVSYQRYLNSLEKEQGMALEILWRRSQFRNMRNWNYENPNILELKYENIVGNEKNSFLALFEHYEFSAELQHAGVQICEELSLKNMKKSGRSHTRSGAERQWVSGFSTANKTMFHELYGDLPIFLGYENSDGWVGAEC